MTLQWRVPPGQSLLHRGWDGQSVLYNDISGATHLLDDATVELLLALRAGELGEEDLAEPGLPELLAELAKLYLVEAC